MALKTRQRATLIGETSYGSIGQPYIQDYDNGMGFRVSAKRESFGDGRPFEGVGIQSDVPVLRTADDLAHGRDPIRAEPEATDPQAASPAPPCQ